MTSSVAAAPEPAIRNPLTRAAIRRRSWLPWLGFLAGPAAAPASVLCLDLRDRAQTHTASTVLTFAMVLSAVIFTVGITVGGGLVWIQWRRRRAVRRHPWQVWPINYISTGRYEWVELLGPRGRPTGALILSTWRKDIGKLVGPSTAEIWFAGDPHRYGVISRPGGGDLRYAYNSPSRQPPRFTFRDSEGPVGPPAGRPAVQSTGGYEMVTKNGQVTMEPPGGRGASAIRHGARNDQRYPSPRMLRRVFAFIVDVVIHLGLGLGLGVLASPGFSTAALRAGDGPHLGLNAVFVVLIWLAAAFANRVVIQSITHTTVGKALFGLVALRPDTGEYPGFGRLLGIWLFDIYLPLAIVGNGIGPDHPEHYFLTAIRRRDRRSRE